MSKRFAAIPRPELGFWILTLIALILYLWGGRGLLPFGGWVARRGVNVVKFWLDLIQILL